MANDKVKPTLPNGDMKEGFDVGESLSGVKSAPQFTGVSGPPIKAYVCKPCGKLLGLVQGQPVPTCCGAKEFTAIVDARTVVTHANGTVLAATHH